MAIVRWEPFRDMVATQERLGRLFGELSRGFTDENGGTRPWAPAVDIFENDQNLVVNVELPGVDSKAVEIRVEDNTLYLKGERKFEKETNEENYHRIERVYGSFARSFTLPNSVDSDKTTAEYKDGILTVTMPKREEAKPKTIKIQAVSKN